MSLGTIGFTPIGILFGSSGELFMSGAGSVLKVSLILRILLNTLITTN